MKYSQDSIPKVSTSDWTGLTASDTRKKMREAYNALSEKTVINKHLGIRIRFDRGGKNKTCFGGKIYPKKASVIPVLDRILRHAEYSNFGERKKTDNNNVIGYLNFKAKIFIDGKLEHLHLIVILKNDGSFHYSLETNIYKKSR